MAKLNVLLEVKQQQEQAFSVFEAVSTDSKESFRNAENLMEGLTGLGITVKNDIPPIPMFNTKRKRDILRTFSLDTLSSDAESDTVVISAEIDEDKVKLARDRNITVWPNSDVALHAAVDCRPFLPGVPLGSIEHVLGVDDIWKQGFKGDNICVGIVDEGVHGGTYPVIGGHSRPGAQLPGAAPVTSHGSMCAADVLLAAPNAKIYDYPFLGIPRSGGVIEMLQAILNQRRIDGTPQVITNSYGYYSIPPKLLSPFHEVYDLFHPINRKVREVVASGAVAFFAAGNCGSDCPARACTSIGPGKSIHGPNSLNEVITIAAVNSLNTRIGYSAQGPGMFEPQKPDLSCYSHFFGNFGPGRPAGLAQPYDNGTSAATPVAAGVAALLISALGLISPVDMKDALIKSTTSHAAFDYNLGYGVIHAGRAYKYLKKGGVP